MRTLLICLSVTALAACNYRSNFDALVGNPKLKSEACTEVESVRDQRDEALIKLDMLREALDVDELPEKTLFKRLMAAAKDKK